jgi:hypothetical protein
MKNKQKSLYSRLFCILSPTDLVTCLKKHVQKSSGGQLSVRVKPNMGLRLAMVSVGERITIG